MLISELEKFSKFYDCTLKVEHQEIHGKQINSTFTKGIGHLESDHNELDWEIETMKNFCFDIGGAYSEKYRLNEIGYEPTKYVSYEKGCYRGQEIIARLKYLGKTTKRAIVFPGSINSISNGSGRKIGKKIFQTKNEDLSLIHI